MSNFYGLNPGPATRQSIEQFENDVMIRQDNQQLVGSVYVDKRDESWVVAFAYNLSRHPGLHGHENPLEVRYSYTPGCNMGLRMFRSDHVDEISLDSCRFGDPDAFIQYVINQEREILNRPV